jgi:hypothetical protein
LCGRLGPRTRTPMLMFTPTPTQAATRWSLPLTLSLTGTHVALPGLLPWRLVRTHRMAPWKAVSLDLVILLAMSGLVVVILRQWLERREQMSWPTVAATVTAYEQGPGFKGRSASYLVGHYPYGGETRTFSVVWGPSDLSSTGDGANSWVPPAGVPALGATIPLHVDPARPSVVALDQGPTEVGTARTFVTVAVLVLVLSGIGIAVWFI